MVFKTTKVHFFAKIFFTKMAINPEKREIRDFPHKSDRHLFLLSVILFGFLNGLPCFENYPAQTQKSWKKHVFWGLKPLLTACLGSNCLKTISFDLILYISLFVLLDL